MENRLRRGRIPHADENHVWRIAYELSYRVYPPDSAHSETNECHAAAPKGKGAGSCLVVL